ncbi:MAG: indole-3-glycerol phosphate synthase TrpC [Gemmataceae bacterium]|nr:indole-3-glycerol phosphate synthase TrpC [Gemmataceae bacterium]
MDILEKIVANKKEELAKAKELVPLTALKEQGSGKSPRPDFLKALASAKGMGLIAEIKKASPSAGVIRPDFDPVSLGRIYEQNQADCISVLTDTPFFQGSPEDLRQVSAAVNTPTLRKDFLIDPYQVWEAKAWGASAALLIAEILPGEELKNMVEQIFEAGLEPLVELFDPAHLGRVLDSGTRLVGINNRNLKTFVTHIDHTFSLLPQIPKSFLVISESGIKTPDEVRALFQAGVKAILVGETLMRSENIGAAISNLRSRCPADATS